jgi:hypothetical protein
VVVTVREYCMGGRIRNARIIGTAEGLVDGHRVSQALILMSLSTPGLYAVRWKRPASGVWVLSFIVDDGAKFVDSMGWTYAVMTGTLAVVRPEGVERASKLLDQRPMAGEIDALLHDLAGVR